MISGFHFACPGEIFFGEGCVHSNAPVFSRCGQRAYIVTGRFPPGVKNLALEDTCSVLDGLGIAYSVDDNTESDPSVESCVEMLQRINGFQPDFFVGIGGGSVMDSVKCCNILLKHPGRDPYEALFDNGEHVFGVGGPNEGLLPFISIATTAGTGADITGVAVMTRADIDNKCGTNKRCFANFVMVDPRYVMKCPTKLNQATAVDALCHGLETYLSRGSADDFMTNFIAERAFALFASFKDRLLTDTMTEEDSVNQALHSTLQGICIVNEVTGVPHGLGYPLSHYFNIPHGLACGVFEGEYLRIFKDRTRVDRTLALMGFGSVDEFCEYIQAILTPHIHLSVTEADIDDWTRVFCATPWRMARHPEPLTEGMVREIYRRALAKFIVD